MPSSLSNLKAVQQALAGLQRAGKLPQNLSTEQATQLTRSLQKHAATVSQKVLGGLLEDYKSKLTSALSMTEPAQMRGMLADLTHYVGSPEVAEQIKFSLKISQEVASGGGRYLNQNLSPEVLDEYPALELRRLFSRSVPRGYAVGPKGGLVAVPGDDWESRWIAAGGQLFDGRMIALKSSPVWQNLGDGVGGYDDTLGNPFPPFAFNSGFMTTEISRQEAVALGLIGAAEQAEPAPINFAKLFAEVT